MHMFDKLLGMAQKTLETLASPLGHEVEEEGWGRHPGSISGSRWSRRLVNILVLQGLDAVA